MRNREVKAVYSPRLDKIHPFAAADLIGLEQLARDIAGGRAALQAVIRPEQGRDLRDISHARDRTGVYVQSVRALERFAADIIKHVIVLS